MIVLLVIFVLAYLAIAFEHKMGVDKSISANLGAGLMWVYVQLNGLPLVGAVTAEHAILHHLQEISGILFFLMGAMTIVNALDKRGSLELIQGAIRSKNQVAMMGKVSIVAFFLSAVLDNMTTTIVMVAILTKVVQKRGDLFALAGMVIIAANAGGAWSPIGDVTTTMLWVAGKVSTGRLFNETFLPSVTMAVCIPLLFSIAPHLLNKMTEGVIETKDVQVQKESAVEHQGKVFMLILGISALLFVPIFKTLTHLPPFMGMMFSMCIVLLGNEFWNRKAPTKEHHITYHHLLEKVEWNAILFFLGILLAVGVFQSVDMGGISSLQSGSKWLEAKMPLELLVVLFGVLSAVIDNVPLVSAAQGMFNFPVDHWFWHLLAYTAGTGGSILIIGSAAGVVAQSMLKIDFMWYMKRFSALVFVSFLAGVGVFFLQRLLVV